MKINDLKGLLEELSQEANGPEIDQAEKELKNEATEETEAETKVEEKDNADIYPEELHDQSEDVEEVEITESSSDFEIMNWLNDNGYEPSMENVQIIREELDQLANGPEIDQAEGELKNEATEEGEGSTAAPTADNGEVYGDDDKTVEDVQEVIVTEDMSDFEIMQALDITGYEPSMENVQTLREALENQDTQLNEGKVGKIAKGIALGGIAALATHGATRPITSRTAKDVKNAEIRNVEAKGKASSARTDFDNKFDTYLDKKKEAADANNAYENASSTLTNASAAKDSAASTLTKASADYDTAKKNETEAGESAKRTKEGSENLNKVGAAPSSDKAKAAQAAKDAATNYENAKGATAKAGEDKSKASDEYVKASANYDVASKSSSDAKANSEAKAKAYEDALSAAKSARDAQVEAEKEEKNAKAGVSKAKKNDKAANVGAGIATALAGAGVAAGAIAKGGKKKKEEGSQESQAKSLQESDETANGPEVDQNEVELKNEATLEKEPTTAAPTADNGEVYADDDKTVEDVQEVIIKESCGKLKKAIKEDALENDPAVDAPVDELNEPAEFAPEGETTEEETTPIEDAIEQEVNEVQNEDDKISSLTERIKALREELDQLANGPEIDQPEKELKNEATEEGEAETKVEEKDNKDVYCDCTHDQSEEVKEVEIKESATDFEIMNWLNDNGYEPSMENVQIIREELAQVANGPEVDQAEAEIKNEATLEKEPTTAAPTADNGEVYGDDDKTVEDVVEVVIEAAAQCKANGELVNAANIARLLESQNIKIQLPEQKSVSYTSLKEACMLDEGYFTTDSYTIQTSAEKQDKLVEQMALLIARENNDANYNELLKESIYCNRLHEAIVNKYRAQATEKANNII